MSDLKSRLTGAQHTEIESFEKAVLANANRPDQFRRALVLTKLATLFPVETQTILGELCYDVGAACSEHPDLDDAMKTALTDHKFKPLIDWLQRKQPENSGDALDTACLVDDVLREIYFYVASQERPYQSRPSLTSGLQSNRGAWLGWMRLTHVSRQWREVGLHIPQLWAELVCIYESNEAVNAILQRAGRCPLTVDVHSGDVTRRRTEIVTGVLTRVSNLSWRASTQVALRYPWATQLSGKELPLLRRIDIYGHCETLEELRRLSEPLVAPCLEECSLSFDIPIVAPNLRELFYDGTTKTSLQRLVTHLSGFQNLVVLYLGTVPEGDSTDVFAAHCCPVRLPSLRYLGCGGGLFTNQVTLFHNLILLPEATLLVKTAEGHVETALVCRNLVRSLRAQLLHPSRTTLRLETTIVHVHAPEKRVALFRPRNRRDATGQDGVVIDARGTPLFRITSALLDEVAGRITSVFVKALSVPWDDDLTALLLPLRAVEELHIWNRTRRTLDALAPRNGSSEIVFPSLNRLVLNFGDDSEDSVDGESDTEQRAACDHIEGWLSGLIPVLQARARAGRQLRFLRIVGPLSGCVGTVKVTPEGRGGCAVVRELELRALRECVGEVLDDGA
ncbi:hypothetical protein PENSPDRAFT_752718 [Peniophora sp. CONT]|nr:hypothetical protein PENSPDRAFT_752718 [Peniophora sp. CONT]